MTRVILVLVLLAFAGAARAGGIDDAGKCYYEKSNLDLKIHYCTRAIQSGELFDRDLAITFYNRGNAYEDKGDSGKFKPSGSFQEPWIR